MAENELVFLILLDLCFWGKVSLCSFHRTPKSIRQKANRGAKGGPRNPKFKFQTGQIPNSNFGSSKILISHQLHFWFPNPIFKDENPKSQFQKPKSKTAQKCRSPKSEIALHPHTNGSWFKRGMWPSLHMPQFTWFRLGLLHSWHPLPLKII